MARRTEILTRDDFEAACPDEIRDDLLAQLAAWEGGDTAARVELTTDRLGDIDSESSPRPAD